jgi:hypothetical protein
LRLDETYTSLLVACGAAAGIAATFNAPIAGALFGLEVVLGSYAMGALVPVFLAAVTGTVLFRALEGTALAIPTPPYAFPHGVAVVALLPLGLFGGLVALAYSRGLYAVEERFEAWRVPWPVKAVAGGVVVGLLGIALPGVLGVGYGSMQVAVRGGFGLGLLAALLAGKYVATLLTIGAGGSGGVFAPSLFLGTMLGGAFGQALAHLFPGFAGPPALYAVAGMGVVFAGAAQAPLTAVVIILEMTGDYTLTVGVAAACVVSYLVHGLLARDSMYTVRLSRRGIRERRYGRCRRCPSPRPSNRCASASPGTRRWRRHGPGAPGSASPRCLCSPGTGASWASWTSGASGRRRPRDAEPTPSARSVRPACPSCRRGRASTTRCAPSASMARRSWRSRSRRDPCWAPWGTRMSFARTTTVRS